MQKLKNVVELKRQKARDAKDVRRRRVSEMKSLKARTQQARLERDQRAKKQFELNEKKQVRICSFSQLCTWFSTIGIRLPRFMSCVNVLQQRSEMIYAAKLNWEQHLKDVELKRVS